MKLKMENIRNFVETIKGIQMSQIIDIGIAILIYGIVNIIENMIFIKKIDDYLD